MISKLYVALLLVLFSASGTSTALAAKAGDKGKGWKVIVGSNGNLQCVYNGKFQIEGTVRDVNSATGGPPDESPRRRLEHRRGRWIGEEKVALPHSLESG